MRLFVVGGLSPAIKCLFRANFSKTEGGKLFIVVTNSTSMAVSFQTLANRRHIFFSDLDSVRYLLTVIELSFIPVCLSSRFDGLIFCDVEQILCLARAL